MYIYLYVIKNKWGVFFVIFMLILFTSMYRTFVFPNYLFYLLAINLDDSFVIVQMYGIQVGFAK